MTYKVLADAVLVAHLIFIIFAAFGGLFILRSKKVIFLHFPCVIWAFIVQWFSIVCPLTHLEIYLRHGAGESGFRGGFIEHYVSSLIYPDVGDSMHIALAVGVVLLNFAVYAFVLHRLRRV